MCLLSCGACISQILLFVLNFLLSLVSLAVTGLGVFLVVQVHRVGDVDVEYLTSAPVVILVVGVVFSAIFFCGCCGAFCKNKCLLSTYASVTIVLATATVVFTVFVFKGVDQLQEDTSDALADALAEPQNKEALNIIEATLGCCGTTGPEFYNSSIPVSCCPPTYQNLQNLQQDNFNVTAITNSTTGDSISLTCPISEAYEKGCVDVFLQYLSKILKVTGQVLIWIIIIEYVAAFLAIFLSCYIGK